MQVKTYGFDLSTENVFVDIDALMQYLQVKSGEKIIRGEIERRIYIDCDVSSEYYIGLVVTVKDQKTFCRLEESPKGITITVENLKGKDKLMEFNFFVINKSNGLGLYQHYHQSCALNVLGQYLTSAHHELRNSLKSKALSESGITSKKTKQIKRDYSKKLEFSPLVSQEGLKKILEQYKEIRSYEFTYTFLAPKKKGGGRPLDSKVNKKREKLYFANPGYKGELARLIDEHVHSFNPKTGSVHAVDYYNQQKVIHVFDMPETFSEEDYDSVAIKLNNLNLANFNKHRITKELVGMCKSDEYKHIFEVEIE